MKNISIYEILKEFIDIAVSVTALITFFQSQKNIKKTKNKNVSKRKKTTSKK
ncbi:MAG: hypothetical protein IJ086_12780 [Clostridium sp.]|nr:hypothetical protein [Clostridium sp.]